MIELQRKLIGDRVRNDAFKKALQSVIVPGTSTVLDLGSGTGFLSFLASRLGAKHCTLIEAGDIGSLGPLLAKRNNIQNCTFIDAHSTDVPVLEQVDVLVSETLGNYALEENILESIEDGKRFLKKNGVIIPGKIRQFVCPVVTPRLSREIDVWETGYDIDLTEAREMSLHNMYVKTIKKEDLLAGNNASQQFDEIDFSKKNKSVRTGTVSWELTQSVTIFGFAVWWEAELVPGVILSTSPLQKPTHWEQIYLPLLQPIACVAKDSLHLTIDSDTRWQTKINLSWQTKQMRGKKIVQEQTMDMRRGFVN